MKRQQYEWLCIAQKGTVKAGGALVVVVVDLGRGRDCGKRVRSLYSRVPRPSMECACGMVLAAGTASACGTGIM